MSYGGNRDILLFDEAVSECLGTHVVYTKRLMDICRPHLLCISPAETLELQNNNIEKKMSLPVPTGLFTEDSTALFWLHPYFAAMLTKHSPKPLYTWSECCNLFLEFCLHSPDHIRNIDDSLFEINPKSKLNNTLKMTYFHKDQIPNIMEQITRFIYKPSTLLSVCPKLTFDNLPNSLSIFSVIEEHIHRHTKLNPFTAQWIYA